jgi:hypothetical protein
VKQVAKLLLQNKKIRSGVDCFYILIKDESSDYFLVYAFKQAEDSKN